ncbi:chemotaxis protein CheB [Planobispora siamensis]|uniref:protein-glutamate methylesterase n=1 Tax=Planobispora siamensis TaxID=936338 RepID=A0A8J3SJT1_9ACTN|nr:chemotaxis protein CheB [Planobispora siamensis]GIH95786.1 chemotaxis protein CheB [Planobispora siamensis]
MNTPAGMSTRHEPVPAAPPAGRLPVIALVSSAGGLAATSRVLGALPVGLPAAVIVLQHLNPDRRSMLPHILGRRTALPVAAACDGQALVPGRVVVAPPGQHLLVTGDRRLLLIVSGPLPPYRPSADLLLTSLALAVGPDAVAVILSGEGRDGATGATAVHRLGGTVITTDRATSNHFAMPQATITRDEIVDHVTALDEVAPLLLSLVAEAEAEATA